MAQDRRHKSLGFSMELDGPRVRIEGSSDPLELAGVAGRIAAWTHSAPAEIDARIKRIESKLETYPTASLLSQLACMMNMVNPETYKEYEIEHLGIELEYASWLALQLPKPISGSQWIDGPDLKALVDDLHGLVRNVMLYHTVRANKATEPLDRLMRKTRINEIAVRNPGYHHHLIELLGTLFQPFDSELREVCGFTVNEAISACRGIRDYVNESVMESIEDGRKRCRLLPSILRTAKARDLERIGLPDDAITYILQLPREQRDKRAVDCLVLLTWNNLHTAMTVNVPAITDRADISHDSASAFLETFSLPFGQKRVADNWPSRYESQSMAPLLKIDQNNYLAHLGGGLLWAVKSSIERSLKDSCYWKRYERHRSEIVEREALRLLTKILSGGRSFRNLNYTTIDEHGHQCRYEVDGLILYDEVLVVLEAKGGSISAAARRGAPSLEEDLKEVLGKAHQQGIRVTKYLESRDTATFRTSEGEELSLRLCDFARVVQVTVTLDSISAFAANWEGLILDSCERDNRSLSWSVELLDLRVISELIEFGPQFIHYLDCLSRLPLDTLGFDDVLDTLGNYFQRGLKFDSELSRTTKNIHLLSHTTEFDEYYAFTTGERKSWARKPAMALDPDTYSRLKAICEAAAPGFVGHACKVMDKWREEV